MLRIDVTRVEGSLIALTGRLAGEEVAELENVLGAIDGPITIDLSLLRSADDRGLAVLRRALASGVELTRATPFIALLLDSEDGEGQQPAVPTEPILEESTT